MVCGYGTIEGVVNVAENQKNIIPAKRKRQDLHLLIAALHQIAIHQIKVLPMQHHSIKCIR